MGVQELIDDKKDGFLFSIGAVIELADIIETVLSNPLSYQELTVAARKKVLNYYDKKQVTQAYYELFKELSSKS